MGTWFYTLEIPISGRITGTSCRSADCTFVQTSSLYITSGHRRNINYTLLIDTRRADQMRSSTLSTTARLSSASETGALCMRHFCFIALLLQVWSSDLARITSCYTRSVGYYPGVAPLMRDPLGKLPASKRLLRTTRMAGSERGDRCSCGGRTRPLVV
jgi:hypothetical protein